MLLYVDCTIVATHLSVMKREELYEKTDERDGQNDLWFKRGAQQKIFLKNDTVKGANRVNNKAFKYVSKEIGAKKKCAVFWPTLRKKGLRLGLEDT